MKREYIVVAFVNNQISVLNRITSAYLKRHINIESLNVSESYIKLNNLTKREYEVIRLISRGFNNKEIATELFISEKTVKNHVFNIFKKIKVTDRTQAALYAIKHNITKI